MANCFAAFSIRIILKPATPEERAGFIFAGIVDSSRTFINISLYEKFIIDKQFFLSHDLHKTHIPLESGKSRTITNVCSFFEEKMLLSSEKSGSI
ncbi:hypothetical protein [Paenibacillus sp. NRS-1780]|uniref:hypothetical protein n=1 Tax=Paenibacillus sp. NRS-1780 TaxID=3233904 RepID=UPI003D288ABE